MTTEILRPDAIVGSLTVSGSVTDIDESVDSIDASYVAATGTASWVRVSFPSPMANLRTGAGIQTFRANIKNTAATSKTVALLVYESGTLRVTGANVSIPATANTIVTLTWDASTLAAVSGANVECRVNLPDTTTSLAAVEWTADHQTSTLTAANKVTSSPIFGTPAFAKKIALVATYAPKSPVIGSPTIGQKHVIQAVSLALHALDIQAPGLKSLSALSLEVGSPVFGAPQIKHPWTYIRAPTVSAQITEGEGVLLRAINSLLGAIPGRSTGRKVWDCRRLCGIMRADGKAMINEGTLGEPAAEAWSLAREGGATFESFDVVRRDIIAETPFSVPGQAVAHMLTQQTLIQMARLASTTEFESRDDALKILNRVSAAFAPAEEDIADEQDAMVYLALVKLRAATVRDLAERGRQLPRVVGYEFADVMPSLWIANRIYSDGGRSEQLHGENKWVHPLFCPDVGVCLSR